MKYLYLILLLTCGCINNKMGAETHYPAWVYEQYNREDAAWIEYCQTNNL